MTWLAMKSPTEDCGKPSSTTTSRLVFLTEAMTVSRSIGRIVRRSMISASMPMPRKFGLGLHRIGHADAEGDDGDVLARLVDARLADRQHEIVELRHVEGLAVEDLVLEEDDRVRIADRGLEQALGVGGRVGLDDLQARDVAVPGGIVLAVLGGDARRGAVRAAEDDRRAHLAAGHVERLGGRVDDLVDRLHGEVEGHELDDRLQAGHRRADADAGKAVLGDRRVDDAARRRTPAAAPA